MTIWYLNLSRRVSCAAIFNPLTCCTFDNAPPKNPPPKKITLCKFKTNLMMAEGLICNLPYLPWRYSSILWVPVFSCLTCWQYQKLLSSRPTPSQSDASLTVAVGEGVGVSLCCHREKCKNRWSTVHSIASRFEHEDLVKTNLFITVCEKSKGKAFYYK